MAARDRRYSPLITRLGVEGDALVRSRGMPAPEQSPVTEEGLLLTIRDGSTGRNMEAENTANNILASVKEQVACPDPWNMVSLCRWRMRKSTCRRVCWCVEELGL
ncbi:unnamed protein product [Tetraodon nigroviridis]|uniref:(spotted green pufferfish) hypothetical protein n=1 Tax=Tetraodon nigroviridis TaxID=99883 RepID=Q4RQK2_TETNG|nr:unnamed protein product [Tetraodon nigroviridis]